MAFSTSTCRSCCFSTTLFLSKNTNASPPPLRVKAYKSNTLSAGRHKLLEKPGIALTSFARRLGSHIEVGSANQSSLLEFLSAARCAVGDQVESNLELDKGASVPTVSAAMKMFNLEEQFSFYLAYHSNRLNTAIHIICVWPLLYTALVFCTFTGPYFPTPAALRAIPGHEYMIFNLAFFIAAVYASYYVILDKKAGFIGAAMAIGCWLGANALVLHFGSAIAWKVAVGVQLAGWVSQFIGHGAFEGRAPALFDNLSQAVLMAPYFVLLEVLTSVVDYEPSPGFSKRVHARASADIKAFREKKLEKKDT